MYFLSVLQADPLNKVHLKNLASFMFVFFFFKKKKDEIKAVNKVGQHYKRSLWHVPQ